jgi:hypothetical protein
LDIFALLGKILVIYLVWQLLSPILSREHEMSCVRFGLSGSLLLLLSVSLPLPLTGCNDDSKTSGTMVQVSEEEKARLQTKRESYKGGPPQRKAKIAGRKK